MIRRCRRGSSEPHRQFTTQGQSLERKRRAQGQASATRLSAAYLSPLQGSSGRGGFTQDSAFGSTLGCIPAAASRLKRFAGFAILRVTHRTQAVLFSEESLRSYSNRCALRPSLALWALYLLYESYARAFGAATTLAGRPSRKSKTLSIDSLRPASRASRVAPPECGVNTTFERLVKGCPRGSGSASKTSSPAAGDALFFQRLDQRRLVGRSARARC